MFKTGPFMDTSCARHDRAQGLLGLADDQGCEGRRETQFLPSRASPHLGISFRHS